VLLEGSKPRVSESPFGVSEGTLLRTGTDQHEDGSGSGTGCHLGLQKLSCTLSEKVRV
jgi:hypothetical protein